MQPNPLINPYNQTTAALMQGLLAETKNRFAIDPSRLSYLRTSVPDHGRPEKAIGYYSDHKRPDIVDGIPLPYSRLDIGKYVSLYPVYLRHLPWNDRPILIDDVLMYLSTNLGILLMAEDIDHTVSDSDTTGARTVTITPTPLHAIWFGQLELWVVAEADLRGLITQRNYPLFDPTAFS